MKLERTSRRSEMETYMDILAAIDAGKQRPTHILYRANLCWTRLEKKLDHLVKQGLLHETDVDGRSTFSLTSKGKDVLAYYKKIKGDLYHGKKTLTSRIQNHRSYVESAQPDM